MENNSHKYNTRKIIRVNWGCYDGGMYFVTICTRNKASYFGRIEAETADVKYTPIGEYAHHIFENASAHHPYAEIPLFMIMPNHIHAIVVIDAVSQLRNTSNVSLLAIIIRSLKTAIQKYATQSNIPFGWQSRFYEHIIRNVEDMNRCALYIENNPMNWAVDKINDNVIR